MKHISHIFWAAACAGVLVLLAPPAKALQLATTRVASGLSLPLYVTSPPGDFERLFIVEQVSAKIKILKNGVVLSTPFLNLDPRVGNGGGEQGLLGMAFHLNYAQNGYFYVNYTNNSGNTVIARYSVTSNPDSADYNSEYILLQIAQPYSNHNGGNLQFGPDGYLWIGTGDGGSAYDPGNRAQNGMELLGKMLRLNVNSGSPYGIPPDNPFVSTPGMLPEIWALGLRNPWRYAFDRLTGDLYIADVGQYQWEEIDFQPAGQGGQNYGWRVWEGNHLTGYTGLSTIVPTVTPPIYEYPHSSGACSVTGGYVYRGGAIPQLQGTYFFADYCNDQIWSFKYVSGSVTEYQNRTAELAPGSGLSIGSISSFGEDAAGEMYICDLSGGEVFKIVASVEINLIPDNVPIVLPPSGGTFTYDLTVKNYETRTQTFDLWIDVLLPDSSLRPVLTRTGLQLPGGGTITRNDLTYAVPASALAGTYVMQAHTGVYPNDTGSLSTFSFEKEAATTAELASQNSQLRTENYSSSLISSVSPNPFNPSTALSYELRAASFVKLTVYSMAGRRVAELVNGQQEAGVHRLIFEGANLATGVYLARIQVGDQVQVVRMMLVK